MATTSITLDEILKRLNAIESKPSSFKRTVILSTNFSSGSLTIPDITQYDVLVMQSKDGDNRYLSNFLDVKSIVWGRILNFPGSTGDSHEDWLYYRFDSATKITITAKQTIVAITGIIGYKWGGVIVSLLKRIVEVIH